MGFKSCKIYDCYNGEYVCDGNHNDPNFVTIAHIDYLYLPSNPSNRVEIIIRDHDDITNPCFYILTEDRSKELYRISLFNNSITDGLTDEDKIYINEFIRGDRVYNGKILTKRFRNMRIWWIGLNLPDEDETPYDNIVDPPCYE